MTEKEIARRYAQEMPQPPEGFDARHDALLRKLTEKEETAVKRKASMGLAMALALLLALAGVAIAAGMGVFGRFAAYYNGDASLSALEELAATVTPQWVAVDAAEGFPAAEFSLLQAHYDGERLSIAYTFPGETITLDFVDPSEAIGMDWDRRPEDDLPPRLDRYEYAINPDVYAQADEILAREGILCVRMYWQAINDWVRLGDGTQLTPVNADFREIDGALVGFIDFETPLPESAQNQDMLALQIYVNRMQSLYYEDKTGGYMVLEKSPEVEVIQVQIQRNAT